MRKINKDELVEITGGFNAAKCAVGTAGGAFSIARGSAAFGVPGMVIGGILGGAAGALASCK